MNEIKLLDIELENFMGIKKQKLYLNEDITNILGANATGKTTVNTAFRWLLFNKDVSDRSDFEIKTLAANGAVVHGLEHSVTATMKVNEFKKVLKKIYKEIWRKKKGSPDARFSGHETIHYIDEVPMLKKDYDQMLNDWIDEGTFKVITDPLYFSQQLKWKDQRKILLEVTGNIEDADIIAKVPELKKLQLEGKSIEDFRKSVAEKRKRFNEDLDRIPTRIDEVIKSKKEYDFADLKESLVNKQAELKEIIEFLTTGAEDPKVKRIKEEIRQLHDKVYKLEVKANDDFRNGRRDLQQILDEAHNKYDGSLNDSSRLSRQLIELENEIIGSEEMLKKLREEWTEIDGKGFKSDLETVCYACKQELPEDDIFNALTELEDNFNIEKAHKLEHINLKGVKVAASMNEKKTAIVEKTAKIAAAEEAQIKFSEALEKAQENFNKFDAEGTQYADEYHKLKASAAQFEEQVLDGTSNAEAIKSNQQAKGILEAEIDNLKQSLIYEELNKAADERVIELKAEQKKIAQKIADIEKQEYLSDEFIKAKVGMLEKRINDKFKYVTFRLFETQVNGAVDETCKALINGVPFADTNRAAKTNAGIDIINTLAEHYQINAPIWVDNRESITTLIETGSQIINLIVEKDQKEIASDYSGGNGAAEDETLNMFGEK